MISREQWDRLTDAQKFEHLFRQTQWAEGAIRVCSEAIDREELRQQHDKTLPKH
jgi:hypothetical protein